MDPDEIIETLNAEIERLKLENADLRFELSRKFKLSPEDQKAMNIIRRAAKLIKEQESTSVPDFSQGGHVPPTIKLPNECKDPRYAELHKEGII
jgi:hypothetical protein